MEITQAQLLQIAETLAVEMKLTLADYLLNSIDPSRDKVDIVWKIEACRRLEEVRASGIQMLPIETVFEEIGKRAHSV